MSLTNDSDYYGEDADLCTVGLQTVCYPSGYSTLKLDLLLDISV